MESDLGNRFSQRRRIALIVTLGLLTGLGPFTIDLYLPAFPVIKEQWALSDAQIQVTLSATTIGFALGQLIVGPLSDRLGRRWPLVRIHRDSRRRAVLGRAAVVADGIWSGGH